MEVKVEYKCRNYGSTNIKKMVLILVAVSNITVGIVKPIKY